MWQICVTVQFSSCLSSHNSTQPVDVLWVLGQDVKVKLHLSSALHANNSFSLIVCRALGVTLWELFENAAQPYPHLSDREVLNHVIKDQQVKLFKPQLELPYSERW